MLTTLFFVYNVASGNGTIDNALHNAEEYDDWADFDESTECGNYNYAFVLDESGSVGQTNYDASIDFVIDLIQNHISDTAQLTALAFNGNQDWIYHFSQAQLPRAKLQPGDPDRIIDELIEEKSDYDTGSTGTKPALAAAIAEFESNGYTQNNILILVTDGMANVRGDPCAISIINGLDNNNIRVIIIGVGNFNPTVIDCLVRGQTSDIIDIDNFDFAPVITQLQQGQIVCGECSICGTPSVCYDTTDNNPCAGNPGAYFPSCTDHCHFIQCNAFGGAFDMPCAPATVWDQSVPICNHDLTQGTYFIGPDLLTWDESNAYCEYYGSTLASIHTQSELDKVTGLCNAHASGNGECHIGMRLDSNSGEFEWSDCSATDYGEASALNCERTGNYIIIVDESGSVLQTNFEKSYDFIINDLVDPVNGAISLKSNIGAFSYGTNNDFVYDIGGVQNDNRASLIAELIEEKNDYNSGVTNTAGALQYAVNMFANAGITMDKRIILLTDGQPCCNSAAYPCTNAPLLAALTDIDIILVMVDDFNINPLSCLIEPGNENVIEIRRDFDFNGVSDLVRAQRSNGECQMIDIAIDGTSLFCENQCANKKPPICNGARWIPGHGVVSAAKTINALNDMNDVVNVEYVKNNNNNNYYGYIMLIGVIAFVLINNIFIGCWCMGKGKKQYENVKFDMVGDDEEI